MDQHRPLCLSQVFLLELGLILMCLNTSCPNFLKFCFCNFTLILSLFDQRLELWGGLQSTSISWRDPVACFESNYVYMGLQVTQFIYDGFNLILFLHIYSLHFVLISLCVASWSRRLWNHPFIHSLMYFEENLVILWYFLLPPGGFQDGH